MLRRSVTVRDPFDPARMPLYFTGVAMTEDLTCKLGKLQEHHKYASRLWIPMTLIRRGASFAGCDIKLLPGAAGAAVANLAPHEMQRLVKYLGPDSAVLVNASQTTHQDLFERLAAARQGKPVPREPHLDSIQLPLNRFGGCFSVNQSAILRELAKHHRYDPISVWIPADRFLLHRRPESMKLFSNAATEERMDPFALSSLLLGAPSLDKLQEPHTTPSGKCFNDGQLLYGADWRERSIRGCYEPRDIYGGFFTMTCEMLMCRLALANGWTSPLWLTEAEGAAFGCSLRAPYSLSNGVVSGSPLRPQVLHCASAFERNDMLPLIREINLICMGVNGLSDAKLAGYAALRQQRQLSESNLQPIVPPSSEETLNFKSHLLQVLACPATTPLQRHELAQRTAEEANHDVPRVTESSLFAPRDSTSRSTTHPPFFATHYETRRLRNVMPQLLRGFAALRGATSSVFCRETQIYDIKSFRTRPQSSQLSAARCAVPPLFTADSYGHFGDDLHPRHCRYYNVDDMEDSAVVEEAVSNPPVHLVSLELFFGDAMWTLSKYQRDAKKTSRMWIPVDFITRLLGDAVEPMLMSPSVPSVDVAFHHSYLHGDSKSQNIRPWIRDDIRARYSLINKARTLQTNHEQHRDAGEERDVNALDECRTDVHAAPAYRKFIHTEDLPLDALDPRLRMLLHYKPTNFAGVEFTRGARYKVLEAAFHNNLLNPNNSASADRRWITTTMLASFGIELHSATAGAKTICSADFTTEDVDGGVAVSTVAVLGRCSVIPLASLSEEQHQLASAKLAEIMASMERQRFSNTLTVGSARRYRWMDDSHAKAYANIKAANWESADANFAELEQSVSQDAPSIVSAIDGSAILHRL